MFQILLHSVILMMTMTLQNLKLSLLWKSLTPKMELLITGVLKNYGKSEFSSFEGQFVAFYFLFSPYSLS